MLPQGSQFHKTPSVPKQMGYALPLPPPTKKMAVGLRATLRCSGMRSQSQTREYDLISEVKRELAAWKERLGRGVFLLGGHKPPAGLGEVVCLQNLLAFTPASLPYPAPPPCLIRR